MKGVGGVWKDLTDSVNSMAGNLTAQVRNIADVTKAVANGDLSKKITVDVLGEILELKDTINTMVDQLRSFAAEVTRVAREVGTEGKLGGQARVEGVSGTWKDLTDSVNFMASNLTGQVRNIADVTKAVANGDLSKKITVDVKGEILELKNTVNTMVDQLSSFASEVTRVAREVGTEGKLGGQAQVKGVAGTWKDLTDNVNFMASNLTSQVRGIAKVVTAVANGDLKQKLTVEAKGEIAALADTINSMIDTLATFADQVTTVAREVGVEGQLGGQAKVPGAAGTWKGLTENVNQLAANLTTQVRAIAEVATAVTKGDLTRSITVEAQGEVAALKDTINEMIRNLKDTTQKNTEQDWLKTNLAKFSRMLQGQRDLTTVGRLILSELAPVVTAQNAVFYMHDTSTDTPRLTLLASYAAATAVLARAHQGRRRPGRAVRAGEAKNLAHQRSQRLHPDLVRPGRRTAQEHPRAARYLRRPGPRRARVGLVRTVQPDSPGLPRSAHRIDRHRAQYDRSQHAHGGPAQTIAVAGPGAAEPAGGAAEHQPGASGKGPPACPPERGSRTQEPRGRAGPAGARGKGQATGTDLQVQVRVPRQHVARTTDAAQQPAHPLGSAIEEPGREPNPQADRVRKTIHSAGNDLLMLINDILDLSKIESGTVVVDAGEVRLDDLHSYVERTFRHVAEAKTVDFLIRLAPDLPRSILTDAKRLQQVLKNLLSNAFKFTHSGQVTLNIEVARGGWSPDNEDLNRTSGVLAFSVTDSGIGIPPDKQQIIFEAFQQADGSTSRKYGGTGLGLAISRELSRLLGGEIRLVSTPGKGSSFTLYLPQTYTQRLGRKPAAIESSVAATSVAPAASTAPATPSSVVSVRANGQVHTGASLAETNPEPSAPPLLNEIGDDRDNLQSGDQILLIVENDLGFARFLLDAAREKGFKGLFTSLGAMRWN